MAPLEFAARTTALILLSGCFLPISTLIMCTYFALGKLLDLPAIQRRQCWQRQPSFKPKTILVTGVGMAKGLALARLFFQAGHNVIGADFKHNGVAGSGCVSRALTRFYPLSVPKAGERAQSYIEALLNIVVRENVDLWVSCSGVASAVEDGEAKEAIEAQTKCKAVQFDAATTEMLHEKDSFIKYVQSLGLDVPETHTITTHADALTALRDAPVGRRYIMKPIGVDDANRGDMSLLPKGSPEETTKHISALRISARSPWILQQFINGTEFCTHALVVRGQVRAFVACPSAELLMHYDSIHPKSNLSASMLRFTEVIAAERGDLFTGHLSFDFIVERPDDHNPVLYPIECNPRAHTAVVLFCGSPDLVNSYLSLLEDEEAMRLNAMPTENLCIPKQQTRYYWIGHDLVEVILRLTQFLAGSTSWAKFSGTVGAFGKHLVSWQDGTFASWDPLPWWWLYHVYWPMQFLGSLVKGEPWSRVNVSTNKVFEC